MLKPSLRARRLATPKEAVPTTTVDEEEKKPIEEEPPITNQLVGFWAIGSHLPSLVVSTYVVDNLINVGWGIYYSIKD
jgi:hypothetical protein